MSVMDSHVESLDEIFRDIDATPNDIDKLEEKLQEATEILAEMKIEVHSVSNKAKKDEYVLKMSQYQRQIDKTRRTLLTTRQDGTTQGTDPRVSATAANERGLEVLQRARAQLAETEETGVNIMNNLATQKETIARTQNNMNKVNQDLSHSNKLLNRMSKWWRG